MPVDTNPRPLSYDDVVVGETVPFGHYAVTEAEMMAFARAFDPQPVHLSQEAARDSIPGRLFASGFFACAMLMRMVAVDVFRGGALGSPGLDEARFLKPIFPGDELSAESVCLEKRPLKSRPGVGMCKFKLTMLRGAGEPVMTWITTVFVRDIGSEPAA
jgi:acyl dehydratase